MNDLLFQQRSKTAARGGIFTRTYKLGLLLSLLMSPIMVNSNETGEIAHPKVVSFYYDIELLGYCGLSAPGVAGEIQRQQRHLKDELGLADKDLQTARTEAWRQAYNEWNNRGLGGFRNWCKTEGVRALTRFTPAQESDSTELHEDETGVSAAEE